MEQNSYEKNNIIKIEKSLPNIKVKELLNSNKKERQEKEKKDLEKIYKKWEQPKLISSKLRKINIIKLYDAGKFDISYDITQNLKNKIKNDLKKKILNDKKKIEDKKKKSFEEKERKKFEEKLKKIEQLKQIQSSCNKLYSFENIKEIEKKMENEINIIYEKANLFLDDKNYDLNEKLNYILFIEKYLKKEVIDNHLRTHYFLYRMKHFFKSSDMWVHKWLIKKT